MMPVILFLLSFYSSAEGSDYSVIQKACTQAYKKNSKDICLCVKNNLRKKLSARQLKSLASIYRNPSARIVASKDATKKTLIAFDYEVHRNCSLNPDWQWLPEDLGTPDPLED
jgi:hypothetical protein